MHRFFKKLIMLVVMLPLLLAACGTSGSSTTSTPSGSCPASRANLKFYVVTHGQSTDPFWSVVKKGVDQAAHGGGEKMGAAGVKHALCVNQEVGNAALTLRCQGFAKGLAETGGTVKEIGVNLSNPTQTQQTVEAALQHDPTIDGILTLGPTGATPTIKALQDLNKLGQIKLATFDLSSDVLNAIKAGQMLFAIDQQQYEQGYLPIVFLTLYKTNLNTVANDIIQTGPGFVTANNVSQVIQLTAQGTR